jgi:hypothetical protein
MERPGWTVGASVESGISRRPLVPADLGQMLNDKTGSQVLAETQGRAFAHEAWPAFCFV